ncbi:Transcriptional regulator, TetR family [Halorubrum sp. DM2]|uniref:TetR/AcrR family transcriptional regulator n=1 Tax=Halorubrum sp. DM2 TaxID=2527867 RepID=UPI0024B81050|nr:TetR/AcrR family transcriptional regulator [Halorubrum sp. DM2]VTT87832.1 Transcriptional regulator, TetR family [Halorubrum sp. DM2]
MDDPFAEPSDTRQAILGAAFRALCEHGYANVTIQRIGDEFDKSPSLVYHHYDGKDELLIDLLEYLLDQFEASIADGSAESSEGDAPSKGDEPSECRDGTAGERTEIAPEAAFDRSARDQLDGYLTAAVDPDSLNDEYAPDAQFVTVMTELRAQAASDAAYRDHFDRSDRVFGAYLERLVREAATEAQRDDESTETAGPGGEAVDPGEVAATLQTFATGGMFRWATTGDRGWTTPSRTGIDRYLETVLPRVDPDAAESGGGN